MRIKPYRPPGIYRFSGADRLVLAQEADKKLRTDLARVPPLDVMPRADFDQMVAELLDAASHARAALGQRVSRGGPPFKVGLQVLMSDIARIVEPYGIPTTGWKFDSEHESRLYTVFRLVAEAAGLHPPTDPRQLFKQAGLIEYPLGGT